jgi:hypothetical protein
VLAKSKGPAVRIDCRLVVVPVENCTKRSVRARSWCVLVVAAQRRVGPGVNHGERNCWSGALRRWRSSKSMGGCPAGLGTRVDAQGLFRTLQAPCLRSGGRSPSLRCSTSNASERVSIAKLPAFRSVLRSTGWQAGLLVHGIPQLVRTTGGEIQGSSYPLGLSTGVLVWIERIIPVQKRWTVRLSTTALPRFGHLFTAVGHLRTMRCTGRRP